MKIGNRVVGEEAPCFIIAEAGVNHNGDVNLALKLIDAAVNAGADAVKFQTWLTEELVVPDTPLATYQQKHLGEVESQFDMLKKLELSHTEFQELKAHADERNIFFLSTPDEEKSADFLEKLGVPAFKIGSAEITNLLFLGHVASKGRPVILSTGMSTLAEVEPAVQQIRETGNMDLILLHCVSDYPASPSDCNLRAMETLGRAFSCPVGFSDHTLGIDIAAAAVARGACVLEKHLTLDKRMKGPDHSASLEPEEFMTMVQSLRRVESSLGNGEKTPTVSELDTKKVVRKSIVSARHIQKGEEILPDHLTLRRTSGGYPPTYLPSIEGRRASRDIKANQVITLDMLQ